MYFLLSIGEVVLADRTPEDYFKMFMLLCRAASVVPEKIFSKRYFRLRLANGHISGFVSSSKELDDRRQD